MILDTVQTEDGSITVCDEETGELYHNRAGAYAEALANYVQPAAIADFARRPLRILDVCFGLGYNSFVLLDRILQSQSPGNQVTIVAVEKDAAILDLIPRVLQDARFERLRSMLKVGASDLGQSIVSRVSVETPVGLTVEFDFRLDDLRKVIPELRDEEKQFDLIFHDPFSPKRVPELWTVDLFRCYQQMLSDLQSKVLTYSSAAAVRGGLRDAGLEVWRTTAVGGKSGGTLACRPNAAKESQFVFALSEDEEARLKTRSSVPFRDPFFDAERNDILLRRAREQAEFA